MISEPEFWPTVTCPKCGQRERDMDGFGFIACIPGCGHCTHPCSTGGVCGICGQPVADGVKP